LAAEEYKEDAVFEQEIVINSIEEDKKENKLMVNALTIAYGNKINPAYFEVNTETANPSFVKNARTLKYGDYLKVNGVIHFRAVQKEIQEDDGWGTKVNTTTTYYKNLEITGAYGETLDKKKYKEDDLVSDVVVKKEKKEKASKFLESVKEIEDNNTDNNDELPFEL
jgi:hypothetical protein